MMHGKAGRKLGRKTPHRKAMMANLCSSLIMHKRVETTLPRAKELRRIADRMITLGKRGTVHARRQALKVLRSSRAVKIVFDDLAPALAERMGGYTRILKLGFRRGDSAPMAMIEYVVGVDVGEEFAPKKEKKGKKSAKGGKASAEEAPAEEKKPKKAKAEKPKRAPKKAAAKSAKGGSASGGKAALKKTTKKAPAKKGTKSK
jgi:large subunit ribosomal protein L17